MSNDMLESKDNNLELELELAINSEKSSTASHRRHESNACVTKGNKTSIRILISLLSIALATLFYNHWSTPDLSSLDRVAYKTVLAELSRWNIHKHQSQSSDDPFHWDKCQDVSDSRFKCGYLEVPLDYTNPSDDRKVRLATTLYRPSGRKSKKSKHTIVIEPGGPGGSGTASVYSRGPYLDKLTDGEFDVLGFDPRGVNVTDPSISCFPSDAFRDRYSLFTSRYRETSRNHSFFSVQITDSYNEAILSACLSKYGDIPRFLSTAFVARDVNEIRKALKEDLLYGYMVSYGTGIGQTYSQMFPTKVGRLILDGLEFVKDHRELGGFGWTSLDNVTNAWEDGFLGECLKTNDSSRCPLLIDPSSGETSDLPGLKLRMSNLLKSLIDRPIPAFQERLGPGIITYEEVIKLIYSSLYNKETWPKTARMLKELEKGNGTLALEAVGWSYDPNEKEKKKVRPSSDELGMLVICADSYDAPKKPLEYWAQMQAEMTKKSFISGNDRFFDVLPCRHFKWDVAEVYRGEFNHTLSNPLLLFGETYDPATPLRNGRRLAKALGEQNAKLVVHHGYGHSSRDTSKCSESIKRAYLLNGTLPKEQETDCFADEKPYPKDGEKEEKFSHLQWLESVGKGGRR